MANEQTVWGLHGGRNGDADELFLKHERIAIGWHEMANLQDLKPTRDAFKLKLRSVRPATKEGAIPVEAGQLFRFVHEMNKGDVICYPSKFDKLIHIGRVIGEYEYNPKINSNYPHLRKVTWDKHVPRTRFSQAALYEIGSAMSLFQIKNNVEEFLNASESRSVTPAAVENEAVSIISENIEQTTRDFVLKSIIRELKGHPLEHFVAHILNHLGYRTRVAPEGADGGVDILAHPDVLGFAPPRIKVQVKSEESKVSHPVVSSLVGQLNPGEFGLVVALGGFTPSAKNFAKSRSDLRLIDGDELIDLTLEFYEQLDLEYKDHIPLRRVYIPQLLQDDL